MENKEIKNNSEIDMSKKDLKFLILKIKKKIKKKKKKKCPTKKNQ